MIRTQLCEQLSIKVPIIQAAIAPYTSPELVAAVSNAGGLGSLGSALRSVKELERDVNKLKELNQEEIAAPICDLDFYFPEIC